MKAQTFIFVHDQQIVLDYKAAGKFAELPEVKYVFLGQRPTDLIRDLPDVVIARELKHNIEHLPNLVAWTGWYAVLRNGLVTADIVNLFEYDVNIRETWVQPMENTNYFPYRNADQVWCDYNDIESELKRMNVKPIYGTLPMTSNYTLLAQSLNLFIWDLEGHSAINAAHPQAGHIAERYCSAYFQTSVGYSSSLQHLYADSHGTQGTGSDYQQLKHYLL